jgi:ankyrin repeat protein
MFINDFNMDINKIGTRGVTALYVAVVNQRYDAVQFLIDHGADVNIPNDEGATPLMQAAFFIHDIKMLKLLIDHGARVNEVGNKKVSALQIATRGGYEEIIAFLLAKQANPNLADKNGFTALMEAVNNKNTAICALLLKAGADCTLKNNKGYTALEMANYYGFQEISNLLKQIAK